MRQPAVRVILPRRGQPLRPAQIQGDAASVAAGNSVFQALKGSPAGMGKAEQIRACTIRREVKLEAVTADGIIARTSGGYATYADTPETRAFLLGSPRDDSLSGGSCRIHDFRMTLDVGDPDRLVSARLSQILFDDWVQVRVDGVLVHADPGSWTGAGLRVPPCRPRGGPPRLDRRRGRGLRRGA